MERRGFGRIRSIALAHMLLAVLAIFVLASASGAFPCRALASGAAPDAPALAAVDSTGDTLSATDATALLAQDDLAVADSRYSPVEGTAYLSVSVDGKFWTSDGSLSGVTMARVPIDLSQLSSIDLADYGWGNYDYDADDDGVYEVTLLHLFIYANEVYGAQGADGIAVSGNGGSMAFKKLFGFYDESSSILNINYFVNGAFPLARPGWGATADDIVIHDGDYIDVGYYHKIMESSAFRYFMNDAGERTFDISGVYGQSVTLRLGETYYENFNTLFKPVGQFNLAGEAIKVCYGTAYGTPLGSACTDENGYVTFEIDEVGDYVVWADGYAGGDSGGQTAPAIASLHVGLMDLSQATGVVNGGEPVYYNGTACKPPVALYDADGQLVDPSFYTVKYKHNDEAGSAQAIVSAVEGKAQGSLPIPFEITAAPDDGSDSQGSTSGDGSGSQGGTGDGSGSQSSASARIDLSDAQVSVASATYTGKKLTPAVVVKLDGKTLSQGSDYTLIFANNKNAGKGKLTVTGKNSYTGTITKAFQIAKATPTLKAKAAKVKLVVNPAKKTVFAPKKVFKVTKNTSKGSVTCKLAKVPTKLKKYVKLTKAGKLTVKKGAPVGTYKLKLKLTVAAKPNYKSASTNAVLNLNVKA